MLQKVTLPVTCASQGLSVMYHHTDVATLPSAGRPSQREEEERRDAVCAPGHAQGTTVTSLLAHSFVHVIKIYYQKFVMMYIKSCVLELTTPPHSSLVTRVNTNMS